MAIKSTNGFPNLLKEIYQQEEPSSTQENYEELMTPAQIKDFVWKEIPFEIKIDKNMPAGYVAITSGSSTEYQPVGDNGHFKIVSNTGTSIPVTITTTNTGDAITYITSSSETSSNMQFYPKEIPAVFNDGGKISPPSCNQLEFDFSND